MAEEILVAALGEGRGARAAAHEDLLRALGDGAGRFGGGAVVAADDRKDFFLVGEGR